MKTAQQAPAAKSEQTNPIEFNAVKTFDTEHALRVLREFYLETRREIKKNKKITISANVDNQMNHLHFMGDGFDLAFILTEGRAS